MAVLKQINDSVWPEVFLINNYAVFMRYLDLAVTGLGYLVIEWTTVVLLGGFVSVLPKKDFWSLTIIMLVQTASAVEGMLTDIRQSTLKGLEVSVFTTLYQTLDIRGEPSVRRTGLAFCKWVVELLVFITALCPLAAILRFGHYISAGLSLWRLIEKDYASADGGPNLKPALDILYSIAVAQGVLYGYSSIRARKLTTGKLAERVAEFCFTDLDMVRDYLQETTAGCKTSQSFARGRNLVTYAVDLMMESKSPDKYLSGVRILGAFLGHETGMSDRWTMIKQLLTGSKSFTYMIQKLLETLGPRSPYSRDIKEHAARIVEHVAGDIRLEQFPRGLQCVSSLLDTFEEYNWKPEEDERETGLPKEYERHWLLDEYEVIYHGKKSEPTASTSRESDCNPPAGYKGLVIHGLRILQKLTKDDDNCSLIINTKCLVSKTIAHLTSDQIHRDYHDEWSNMALESLELMSRLIAAPGETGMKMCHEISRNTTAVTCLQTILECCECEVLLKRQAAEILLDMSTVDASFSRASTSGSSNTIFMWMLLHIFLLPNNCFRKMCGSTDWMKKKIYIRKLAGGKLLALRSLQGERNVASMVESVVGGLTKTITATQSNTYRTNAAKILEHICRHYTKDGVYMEQLKKATANVMPEILEEILLGCRSESKEIKGETSNIQFRALGTDIEKGDTSQDIGQENTFSSNKRKNDEHANLKLRAALIYLSKTVYDSWSNVDPGLARYFDEISAKICSEQGKPINAFSSLMALEFVQLEIDRLHETLPFRREERTQEFETGLASSSRQALLNKAQCSNCSTEICVYNEDSQHLLSGYE